MLSQCLKMGFPETVRITMQKKHQKEESLHLAKCYQSSCSNSPKNRSQAALSLDLALENKLEWPTFLTTEIAGYMSLATAWMFQIDIFYLNAHCHISEIVTFANRGTYFI